MYFRNSVSYYSTNYSTNLSRPFVKVKLFFVPAKKVPFNTKFSLVNVYGMNGRRMEV